MENNTNNTNNVCITNTSNTSNTTRNNRIQKKLPRPNINLDSIIPIGNTKSKWNQIHTEINNVLGKGIILNIHSELGEMALMGISYLVEMLYTSNSEIKINVIDGFSLNNLFVDFDGGNDITQIVNGYDLVVIPSINSVSMTDYKKEALGNLLNYAKVKKVPLIVSSKEELLNQGINQTLSIINVKLKDEIITEAELFAKVFGGK